MWNLVYSPCQIIHLTEKESKRLCHLLLVEFRRLQGPVQTGNDLRPNMIKHGLVTKHVDVVLSGQTVSNMFE